MEPHPTASATIHAVQFGIGFVDGHSVNRRLGDVPHVSAEGRLVDLRALRHRQHGGGNESSEVDLLHRRAPTLSGSTFTRPSAVI
jgi:hypothetical protein